MFQYFILKIILIFSEYLLINSFNIHESFELPNGLGYYPQANMPKAQLLWRLKFYQNN